MQSESTFDRIRAWVEGSMSHGEVSAFERTLELDPELRKRAHSYRKVHEWTAPLESECGRSSISFEALAARLDEAAQYDPLESPPADAPARPTFHRRKVAAAALVLLGSITAFWHGVLAPEIAMGPETLELAHLPLPGSFPWPPKIDREALASISGYQPVVDGRIQWLDDYEEALSLSRLTGRPVMSWAMLKTCPYCKQMDATTMRDSGVLAKIEGTIPLRVGIMQSTEGITRELLDSYELPVFEWRAASGESLGNVIGVQSVQEFSQLLDAQLSNHLGLVEPIAWSSIREYTALWKQALELEDTGDWSAAYDSNLALGADGIPSAFASEGERGMLRLAQRASMEVATAAGLGDPPTAEGHLVAALERLQGTPLARDLEDVSLACARRAPFP